MAQVGHEEYLRAENWELDLDTSSFPNSPMGRSQEFNDETHPHLQVSRTMVSIPAVRPGDQAWWHAGEQTFPRSSAAVYTFSSSSILQSHRMLIADMIHAVEAVHQGKGPSAVMYIPSVPLTTRNLEYVRDQRESFLQRRPPPDFPGGVGESQFEGTGSEWDITTEEGQSG